MTAKAPKPVWVHVAWLVFATGTVVLLIWIVLGVRALSQFTRTVSPLWILAAMLAVEIIEVTPRDRAKTSAAHRADRGIEGDITP